MMLWTTVLLACSQVADVTGADRPTFDSDVQDLLLLGETRPVRIRLHLRSDGRPFQQPWGEYLTRLFTRLDLDRDGRLKPQERARLPAPNSAFGRLADSPTAAPQPLPIGGAESLTLAGLADLYRRFRGGPFDAQSRPGRSGAADELFSRLDRNSDRSLSANELSDMSDALARLDFDGDECIVEDELLFGSGGFGNLLAIRSRNLGSPLRDDSPLRVIQPGDQASTIANQLILRYGPRTVESGEIPLNSLTRDQVGFDPAQFRTLDSNGDAKLDADELANYLAGPAEVELTMHFGDRDGRPAIEPTATAGPTAAFARAVQVTGSRATIALPDTHLELTMDLAPAPPNRLGETFQAQFRAADVDGNKFLDVNEGRTAPFFRGTFAMIDRNGDERLFEDEVRAYIDEQTTATSSRIVMAMADNGRAIFDMLDANRDQQLGRREQRAAASVLSKLDRDDDGELSVGELPRHLQLTFSRGQTNFVARAVVFNGPEMRAGSAGSRGSGPVWFRKMDRNNDGDVSRSEFLGDGNTFRRLDADGDSLISEQEAAAWPPVTK